MHKTGNVIESYFLTIKSVRQANSISSFLNMSSIAEVHCWEHQAFCFAKFMMHQLDSVANTMSRYGNILETYLMSIS